MSCELCEAKKITHWYYEDNICWVADCKTCSGMMIVFRKHREPTITEIKYMNTMTTHVLGHKDWHWRGYRRQIKDHWHEHIIIENSI